MRRRLWAGAGSKCGRRDPVRDRGCGRRISHCPRGTIRRRRDRGCPFRVDRARLPITRRRGRIGSEEHRGNCAVGGFACRRAPAPPTGMAAPDGSVEEARVGADGTSAAAMPTGVGADGTSPAMPTAGAGSITPAVAGGLSASGTASAPAAADLSPAASVSDAPEGLAETGGAATTGVAEAARMAAASAPLAEPSVRLRAFPPSLPSPPPGGAASDPFVPAAAVPRAAAKPPPFAGASPRLASAGWSPCARLWPVTRRDDIAMSL